jgi:pyruvate formate lyase activating enzyme
MQDALFYKQIENQRVQCHICPHRCLIEPGQNGLCHTRKNEGGKLYTRSYGILSAISTDPIEKKPLYHFYPGKDILSIGSYGCNLSCDFCQNCNISQIDDITLSGGSFRDPEDIVSKADQHRNNIGLAYTYNEPTVYFEFMIRCATLVRERKMRNVMVTNGYINPEPLDELLPFMDAFNIDLKSFSNKFYKNRSGASLRPVLETISRVARSESHLELTFLIIPGHNDNEQEWKEMLRWIADHCGRDIVLHVSRYYPRYKMYKPSTPLSTIEKFLDMARPQLDYVYPGNTPQLDNHSYCPSCGNLLVERYYYNSSVKGIGSDGCCSRCNKKITGVFVNDNL